MNLLFAGQDCTRVYGEAYVVYGAAENPRIIPP
jgi:hypothetical protein